jgi:hypothetical protein
MIKINLRRTNQKGLLVVSLLIVMVFLSLIVSALIVEADVNLTRARGRILLLEAQYAAESGVDAAIAQLNSDLTTTYAGTGTSETTVLTSTLYKATFSTTVTSGSSGSEQIITSTGRVYQPANATTAKFTRKIEVTAKRTSSSVVASGMLARNILQFDSSVKDVYAKDLYINNYILTSKNTTNLISENIVVAGRNTGAANCSIGGPGNLVKPTSFVTPGQTKTNITTAYNNCISPPGNTSNSNFTVAANQTNIAKIQSTYIPWSQYMDSNYKSANSCSDWTTGSSPRNIPSTGNDKKTHYPDSGSNISSSCGTSGDLALGTNQYNIKDNAHIRANLCASSACAPTFYNPDSTPKYIFVEGTINFNGVTSASGSGPIILMSYGADPASKSSVCPLGGAVYLGSSGSFTVNAPDIYFIAMNGLCFDKTKFGGTTSFGGISGKNIYISTNPGTPHDPSLNTTFPLSDVPLDLAWHAALYRRLK